MDNRMTDSPLIDLHQEPFDLFALWLADAETSELNDPNAMVLTTSLDNKPSARTVLLKAWDRRGFVFYTNLESRKSTELRHNPSTALLFHWKTRRRQIRIEGTASSVNDAEADAYFASRARPSRIGAWASAQSRPMADRAAFDARITDAEARFAGGEVPRPPHWSGWRVAPERFEFWEDRDFRLHDRAVFERADEGWTTSRLYP
jgi:pyridoxamine 5'-phosphate oxidase